MGLLPSQHPSVRSRPAGTEQTSPQRLDAEVVWGLLGCDGILDGSGVLDERVVDWRELGV